MDALLLTAAVTGTLSLLPWLVLVFGWGQFWRTDQRLSPASRQPEGADGSICWPSVAVIVPARNEAPVLPHTLPALLQQDYAGRLHIFLVDDCSDDGTANVARTLAGLGGRLTVVAGEPLPAGWTGKVWAMQQGVQASETAEARLEPVERPDYILFTDADIAHAPHALRELVLKARRDQLDMVSLMARLHAETFWERLLIPAFVYFFAKLYPFRWVSDRRRRVAAAAGGCVLVRRAALERAGGLESIRSALIDDCALASRVKHSSGSPRGGRIWLGLAQDVCSLRRYEALRPIWDMVARSAYAQLRFSPLVLAGTVLVMLALYAVPPAALLLGLAASVTDASIASLWAVSVGIAAWTLMSASYVPMLRWHRVSPLFAPLLPLVAMSYTLMTVDSALRWYRGEGGAWKGRRYGIGDNALKTSPRCHWYENATCRGEAFGADCRGCPIHRPECFAPTPPGLPSTHFHTLRVPLTIGHG